MNILFLFLAFGILVMIPLSSDAFAQTSYDVNIPTGTASPDSPYFWQSEKDGSTNGIDFTSLAKLCIVESMI